MSLADDYRKPKLTPEGKFALVLLGCVVLVFIPFVVAGKPDLGLGTCISMGAMLIAMRFTWSLHSHRWYWGAVAVAILIQVPFILYVPWSSHAFRGTALLPFGFVDFIIAWGCIKAGEKIMGPK
jgi:hypothetical protein